MLNSNFSFVKNIQNKYGVCIGHQLNSWFQPICIKIITQQCLDTKINKRPSFKNKILFSEFHFDTTLQDNHKVVALFAAAIYEAVVGNLIQTEVYNDILFDQLL